MLCGEYGDTVLGTGRGATMSKLSEWKWQNPDPADLPTTPRRETPEDAIEQCEHLDEATCTIDGLDCPEEDGGECRFNETPAKESTL
jgi:hypothetical protein